MVIWTDPVTETISSSGGGKWFHYANGASQRKMKNPVGYSDYEPERSLSYPHGCEGQKWRISGVIVGNEEARKLKVAWRGKTVKRKNKQRQTAQYLFPQSGRMSTLEKRSNSQTLPCSHWRAGTKQCSLPSASISVTERNEIRGDHGIAYGNI